MAKQKPNDEKTDHPTELTLGDQWRNAQRKAIASGEVHKNEERAANDLASQVAKKLIEEHGGAPIVLDGVTYQPKKSPIRKDGDGNHKTPEFPYMLARKGDKAAVEV